TWSMLVFEDRLYIGTFDWSLVARGGLEGALGLDNNNPSPFNLILPFLGPIIPREGADLFWVGTGSGRAFSQSLVGVGNFTNYGVRNMTTHAGRLYLGTAN